MGQRRLLAALLLFLTALTAAARGDVPPPPGDALGCFGDSAAVDARLLPYVQLVDAAMTPALCARVCAARGFALSGTQFARECYCGRRLPASAQRLADAQCATPCAGDAAAVCGGALALSVRQSQPVALSMLEEPTRPLVCLVMILKNEAHTIATTLKSVRDHVDCYHILDTGSTDGTARVIAEHMRGLNGGVYNGTFVDYGATRNRILEIVAALPVDERPVFTLILSADEVVRNAAHMRAFLADMRYAFGSMHGATPVVMRMSSAANAAIAADGSAPWDSVRIARVDDKWRYAGRVHEYLTSPARAWTDLYRPRPPIDVAFRATDPERRAQSQFTIIRILQEEVARNPRDSRSWFYLARTLAAVGNRTAALSAYERLGAVAEWDEEVYEARFAAALLLDEMRRPWPDVLDALSRLHEWRPSKADAVYYLGDRAFNAGKYHTAFMYAVQASSIRDPGNLWRVENVLMRESRSLYAWRALRLLGFAANRVGEWAVCADALAAIGARRPADEIAARWRADCVARMPQTGGAAMSTMTTAAHDSTTSELLGVIPARALGAGARVAVGDGKSVAPVTTRTARPRLQPDRAVKKPSILVSLATDISSGSAAGLSPFVWGAIGGASGASLCMAAIVAIRKLRAARAKRV